MDTTAILALFNNLINAGTAIGVVVAAFYLMVAGFMYMGASGNPRQMETAKSAMTNVIFGLVIVIACRAIAALINAALTGSP